MNRLRLIRPRYVAALTLPVVWLLVSGCSSIEKESPEKPGGLTTARVVSTNPVSFEIEDDHVVVRGALNGHEVRLLLDTGASHVLVSLEAAAAAGIRRTKKIRVGAFEGNERGSARQSIADSVAVWPAFAEKVTVVIMPLPPVFEADGILGHSFLRQFIFRLDYQQKLVSFASPANNSFTGVGSSVPLQNEGILPIIQAEVDGAPARLMVDTGAGQALILKSWFVEEQKLRERYPRRLSMVTGANMLGPMRGEIARLQTLKLGDYTLTNVFAEFETKTNNRRGDIAGFVGAPILRRFNLTFDPPGQRMWIEPNASYWFDPPPPGPVRSGMGCLPEGTNWIVQDIIPDSPAAEAGVRRGDRLLEINGVPVQSVKSGEIIKRAFQAEPGTRVRVRLQTSGETPREAELILRDLL